MLVQSYENINKVYLFEKPIDVFVSEFNELQQREAKQLDKLKIAYKYDEDEEVYIDSITGDTLIQLVKLGKCRQDTIYVNCYFAKYRIYEIDGNKTALCVDNLLKMSGYNMFETYPAEYEEYIRVKRFQKKNAFLDNKGSALINRITTFGKSHANKFFDNGTLGRCPRRRRLHSERNLLLLRDGPRG
ncbi:MAG: hypothetical protein ACK5JU_04700 [Bacteroidales bacterium]